MADEKSAAAPVLTCPSAQMDMEDPQVLGVMAFEPEGRRLAYVNGHVPVTDDLLQTTGDVPPERIYRFAANCMEGSCRHFAHRKCGLAERMVVGLQPTVDKLPPCAIRKTCRWHVEAGAEACLRCSQVVTHVEEATPQVLGIIRPEHSSVSS